jgi:hypothetical protein
MRFRVHNVMPEDFDAILDHCIAEIAAGRETIDSCLRRYPAQADRLAALLAIAQRARTLPSPAPLPMDKRRALESRLIKHAGQLRSKPVSRSTAPQLPLWRRSVALAMASLVAVALLLGSVVGASAASVPGDVLYPVKRTAEQVRLALTPAGQQVDLHLEFAQQRLQELSVLQDRGKVSEELLVEISDETTWVLDRVPALTPDRQQAVLMSLTDFEDQHLKVLEAMASSVKGEEQTKLLSAAADSTAKRQQASNLLMGAASTATPVGGPSPEPQPTSLEETQPAHGRATARPVVTDKPVPQATPKATNAPPATPQKPTPKVEHTPPGQADHATPHSPPPKPTKIPKK